MAASLNRRTLNTQNDCLEVWYQTRETKIQVKTIALKCDDLIYKFSLSEVRINGQPAQFIKQIKATLLQENFLYRAEIVDQQLHLFSESFKTMRLHFLYDNQNFPLFVSPQLKTAGLYQLIANEIKENNFDLFHPDGSQLAEGSYTLQSCGLAEDNRLTIFARDNPNEAIDQENKDKDVLEIGMAKLPFVNFKDEQHVLFDKGAPIWRTVIKGLSLEGRCTNADCKAYNELVCDPKGMGDFHMHETCTKASCPCCQQKLSEVTNCFFWDCLYSIEGQEENSGNLFKIEKRQAPTNQALSFLQAAIDSGNSNIVNWNYLKISTSKISGYLCVIL